MAVLHLNAANSWLYFTPVSSALNGLPNGAATIALLARRDTGSSRDMVGFLNSAGSNWYHSLGWTSAASAKLLDDDGLASFSATTTFAADGTTADDYRIIAITWPAGGAAVERSHISAKMGAAESWTHENSTGNNGGNRAGPGTSGHFRLGYIGDGAAAAGGLALVGVWAGVQLSDAQIEELWTSKKTSDWWNNSAGQPTMLVECTSDTPTDIGASPSTFSTSSGASPPTATDVDPTGWTFDGTGAAPWVPEQDSTAVLRTVRSTTRLT